MARGNRDYDRDYADPLELPPEPIGFWGLSERSDRWARDEDSWGTSGRTRERARGRREGGRTAGRGSWGGPGYGRGDGRPYGAYEHAPEGYGRSERGYGSERQWRRPHGGVSSGEVDPASLDEGTGAWGPGQAEPGLWGREPERVRRTRSPYDRGFDETSRRGGRGDVDWNGYGYQWTGGRGARDWRGRPARTPSDEWGQYRRGSATGAWDYGRQRRSMLRASDEAARGRSGAGRPDVRAGEAWDEVGPARWTHEERPVDREGFAKEWDRGFYFGREDKGGGTPPSVGRHKWTRGTGPGPNGQENREDYGPPGRGSGRGAGRR